MRKYLILLVLCGTVALPAMAGGPLDGPLTSDLTITERKAGFRVLFNFDFRRTFVNAERVQFYGFRLGAQRNRNIIAIGAYGLGEPHVETNATLGPHSNVVVTTDFDFALVSYERLLIDSKRWQVGVPLALGLGSMRRSYNHEGESPQPYSVNELVPMEISLHTDYNIFFWLFAGVGGGYRYVLAADKATTTTLSDWTYYFKVGVRVGALIKRARKELNEHHGS